jgi:anti-sigma factor RsiW
MYNVVSGDDAELSRPVIDEDLHAYIDRELDVERLQIVESYLAEHAESARRVSAYTAQREALRAALAGAASEPIPPRLDPRLLYQQRQTQHRMIWRAAAAVVLAIGLGGGGGWGLHIGYDRYEQRSADAFGQQAAAAYLALAQSNPQSLQVASFEGLSESVTKALGVPVQFHDTAGAGFTLLGGWVLSAPHGQGVQLAFRDTSDNKLITMYLEGRPGAKDTPFRRVAGVGVPTVAWDDDDLACAISGSAEPERLEQIGKKLYDALLS